MTAPPSTPTARELARACVHVHGDRGVAYVGYRAPGSTPEQSHGLTFAYFTGHNSADPHGDAARAADALVLLLAPLVDLGLRHAEARRLTPIPPTLPDPQNVPDDADG